MNMNMNTSSPGVREPLYPHQEDRRRTEDEEEMDIIITKIQEDQTYRSSSRLVRIIQVLNIFVNNSSFRYLQDIRGVLPCLITMLVLIIVVLTVFPYVFSYVFRFLTNMS